ncbi:MAG: AarF/ABC1/UbiB kinase family protein [Polyangiaceae bacterium]|nr:AarF/ABC1/UbiB kinase family protein [Polyangiaceae bacterium]
MMLQPRKPATQSYRFIRAYATTFTVIGSYLLTYFLGRVFGAKWLEARLETVHAKNARRVQTTIVDLQGLFIKVGQLLSVLANFLPAPFRDGLAALQDSVPPRPTDEIRRRIERDLGKPVVQLFAKFSDEPLASASLGQVHEAWLDDGQHVAVKVQHADIDEIVRLDLGTIRRIMRIVSLFLPAKNLDVYYRQIKAMIQEELDFEREAKNIERIMQNFAADPMVVFPKPIANLSTKTVMTTTFVNGIKVGDMRRIDEAKIDRKALARKIVETFCQMVFVDGIYHADPHPGNMLVGASGELVLLDFGAVAELSRDMREGIPEFLEGVIRRDTERIIRALKKMGFISRHATEDVSERVVEFFHQRFQEDVKLESFNLKDIKLDPQKGLENLISLRRMNIGLRELSEAFHVPRDWVYLERTLLLLTGVCTELDPDMNPVEIIQPYAQRFVLGNRDWAQIAVEAAKDMALKAITLPEDLRKYLMRANRGESEVRVRDLTRAANTVARSVRQLVFAALSIAGGYGALQLYLAGHVQLARNVGIGAASLFGLLLLGMLFSRPRA